MGSRVISVQRLVNIQQLDVNLKKLECYSCKQLLKDSYLTLTLTLKVNIHSLVYGFKDKSCRTDMVIETAESTGKSSNFHVFWS